MTWNTIHKSPAALRCPPNLNDYAQVRADFSWDRIKAELEESPGGGFNMAHKAVDRHANGPLAQKTALRWISKKDEIVDFTYLDLKQLSNRFAQVLHSLGVGKGERVFGLTGRIPELYQAVLGTLKNGSVFCPLFSAFGPEPIKARMTIGDAAVLVTTPLLYKRKVLPILDQLPQLKHVIVIGDKTPAGTLNFAELMRAASDEFTVCPTDIEDMALVHFTSGTTGKPKGAVHVHAAVIAHYASGRYALDLHPEDVFWCTADPGWVTGISYGMISPLSNGVTLIVDEAESYRIPAEAVDGMDVLEVEEAAHRAVAAIRETGTPYFLELRTYRFRAHSMFDAELYRDKSEVESWKEKGPIRSFVAKLQAAELITEDEIAAMDAEIEVEVQAAVDFAEAGTWEPESELTRDVYSVFAPLQHSLS